MSLDDPLRHDPLRALAFLIAAGCDEAIGDEPLNRFEAPRPEPLASPRAPDVPAPRAASVTEPARPAAAPAASTQAAQDIAQGCATLDALKAALLSFEGCGLKRTATQLVFADGNPQAPLMFVGEAPGRDEDLKGLPFVGASGQLLDRIMAGIGRTRDNSYITNVILWRPPGNREPTVEETSLCLPFLYQHIALVRPKVIVALGNIAAKQLFGSTEGITRLRGRWGTYSRGGLAIPLIATFHPANLLRNPINKRQVWRDFLAVAEKLEHLGAPASAG
ncbi:MAG: uracil-DNA glycosylase [Alphaproteobacteria bacterium]|nr:uracil-DNA glycosylase [Alphaproteobacteria bacterium]